MKRTIARFTMYTGSEKNNDLREIGSITRGIRPDADVKEIVKKLMADYKADEVTVMKLMTCEVDE